MMRLAISIALVAIATVSSAQNGYISKVWVSDLGNGEYRNPVLYADYSDPDAIRVGDDFYMTSSSFGCIPGLQILHSKDLVNWEFISAAIPWHLYPYDDKKPEHGNRVWAPSIRYHGNEFLIYWGDPDYGLYMTRSKDIRGPWSEPVLVKAGKGLIDCCPFWDEDGKAYMVQGYAASRAGQNSILSIFEMNDTWDKAVSPARIVFDGHGSQPTSEGPKLYKRGEYYYIFHPAGGVPGGWQTVERSKSIYGPYETRIVLAQGKTETNGPHQGAWVTTQTGEDWFIHFQDVGAYGRIMHLEPMKWVDGWPVIGIDKDGDGCGEPVLRYRKPDVGKTYPVCTPLESDDFDAAEMGPQWQWNANLDEKWAFFATGKGYARLYSPSHEESFRNMWDVPNLMLQKMPAPIFQATAKITFSPSTKIAGERTGLIVMGLDYAGLFVENTPNGLVLSQTECQKADKGKEETVTGSVSLDSDTFYLRACINTDFERIRSSEKGVDLIVRCRFLYSLDGKKFLPLGKEFQVKEGKWIGAKVGVFCCSLNAAERYGGWADIDYFHIDRVK